MDIFLIYFLASFILSITLNYFYIKYYYLIFPAGQPIRVKMHAHKYNTPVMGGVIFTLVTVCFLLLQLEINVVTFTILLSIIFFAGIGLIDDLLKIYCKSGLDFSIKLLLQIVASISIVFYIYSMGFLNSSYVFPGIGVLDIGIILAFILSVLIVLGTANAANLTDGLDGLLSGVFIINIAFFLYVTNNWKVVLSPNLAIEHIDDIQAICYILAGTLMAFLWYNCQPAKVFMGDVGSLALGSILGVLSILLKVEVVFFFTALLLVVETISVIIRLYFKDICSFILAAPLHHHFERKGYSEANIMMRFWIFNCICCVLSILLYDLI